MGKIAPPLGPPIRHTPLTPATALAITSGPGQFQLTPAGLFFTVSERAQGNADLNGDGDDDDVIGFLADPATMQETNLGLAVTADISATEDFVVLPVVEAQQGAGDLNGDGDAIDRVYHIYDTSTGAVSNTGLCTANPTLLSAQSKANGRWASFAVHEFQQGGEDLNGDGDIDDQVLFVYDTVNGTTDNLGLAILLHVGIGDRLLIVVEERAQGADINGDGDTADQILFTHDLNTGISTNLAVQVVLNKTVASELLVFLPTSELASNTDLNGDGDQQDVVMVLYDELIGGFVNTGLPLRSSSPFQMISDFDLSRDHIAINVRESDAGEDFNGDGDLDDEVVFTYEAGTGVTVNTGLSGNPWLGDTQLAVGVFEYSQGMQDLNGDGDMFDQVVHVLELP